MKPTPLTPEQDKNITDISNMSRFVDFLIQMSVDAKMSINDVADCLADMARRRQANQN